MTIGPNVDSERLLRRAVERSKRTSGVQLDLRFTRRGIYSSKPPPLAQLLRGGRGGEVRIKLYLCLNLIATARPYRLIGMPARVWAEAIGLPDPSGNGARRIADALDSLSDSKLIHIDRH